MKFIKFLNLLVSILAVSASTAFCGDLIPVEMSSNNSPPKWVEVSMSSAVHDTSTRATIDTSGNGVNAGRGIRTAPINDGKGIVYKLHHAIEAAVSKVQIGKGRKKGNLQEDNATAETQKAAEPEYVLPADPIPAGSFTPEAQNDPIIHVTEGVTELIKIAKGTLNRIQLPFEKPKVLTVNAALANCDEGLKGNSVLCIDQGSMYVATTEDSPISLFVTDSRSQHAISITLQPFAIPPRDVKLVMSDEGSGQEPSKAVVEGNEKTADSFERGQPYLDTLTKLLREIALGQVPPGYSLTEVNDPKAIGCQFGGMRTHLAQILEGAEYVVNIYVVENISGTQMLLNEQACYAGGVLAAAAWPRVVLNADESTEVYVVSRRDTEDQPVQNDSRPLLVN